MPYYPGRSGISSAPLRFVNCIDKSVQQLVGLFLRISAIGRACIPSSGFRVESTFAAAMAMSSHAQADMLLALITTNFPDPESSARGHKTFFCTSCNTGPHPLNLFVEEGKQHHGHNKLQVYRTSNRPSVLEEEIGNLLVDLQSIQRYSINQKTVVFITGPNSKIYCPNPKSNMIRNAACSSSLQLTVSTHATPSCAKCTKLLNEATGGRFSSNSSIFCSLGCKFAEQLFNMQADRINAAPLAAVTGANVNTVQHSTKQSQEALANHTTSDGARSNAVGPTEEVCFHGQRLNVCRSTGRSSKRRLQSGLNRKTILAPQRAPLS